MRKFNLLYPERRTVTEQTLVDWYLDYLADGRIPDPNPKADVDDMIAALSDIGVITVERYQK